MTTADPKATEPITADFARRFDDDYLDAWNSHDPERLIALSDPQIRWEDPHIRAGRLDGHAALRDWLRIVWRCVPDLTVAREGELYLATDGRSVTAAWTGTATMTGPLDPPGFAPTGRPVRMLGMSTLWFRDGRMVRVRTITDGMAVARQLLAVPEPGSAAEKVGVLVQRLAARRARRKTVSPRRPLP